MRLTEAEDKGLPPEGVSKCDGKSSLFGEVSHDVARILLRRFFVPIVGWVVTTGLVVLCGWLIWRGSVSLFTSSGEHASLAAADPEVVPAASDVGTPAALATTGIGAPVVLASLLAILLLPVVTISFIRTMVSKRSNGVNALTLAIYTAIDFILSFFMMGASLETTGKAVLFIGIGVFSLLYNFTIMNYALKLEDGR